jgi:predicted aspartyl protease
VPILHTQYAAEGKQVDGKVVQLPPKTALQRRGPVVQVNVTIEQTFAKILLSQGKPLPPTESGWALIDTGASQTCIDDAVAQRLGLPVIDVALMTSASHAATQQNIYPVQIEMVGIPISIGSPRTMGANLKPQGILLLIGRDVLQHGTLMYNGIAGQITFAI